MTPDRNQLALDALKSGLVTIGDNGVRKRDFIATLQTEEGRKIAQKYLTAQTVPDHFVDANNMVAATAPKCDALSEQEAVNYAIDNTFTKCGEEKLIIDNEVRNAFRILTKYRIAAHKAQGGV